MNNLIDNDSVVSIVPDQEAGRNIGDIFFFGGECYNGEISNNLPQGEGELQMKDGSIFKGKFENK